MNLKPFTYSGRSENLRLVQDEILVDFPDGVDSRWLEETCCAIAVRDWCHLGQGSYVLRVRPDMRGMLTSQLEGRCAVLRVYQVEGSGGRSLFTGKMGIGFTAWSSQDDRRSLVERYFPRERYRPGFEDGIYQLSEILARDLGKVWRSLALEDVILRVTPVLAGMPTLGEETHAEDFLTALTHAS